MASFVRRWIFRLLITAIGFGLVVLFVAVLYGSRMSGEVRERFDGRKWSVPSRVYSDSLLLYPGQRLPLTQLTTRLDRMGYRAVAGSPKAQGTYRRKGRTVSVYLRAVDSPVVQRPAMKVRIDFSGRRSTAIKSMRDLKKNESLPLLELEPEELMQVFGDSHESRQLVSVDRVPTALVDAVLAAEDADFYHHGGVDWGAVLRALYVNTKAGSIRQGGSTLTQQLAKTFFLSPTRSVWRKARELIIAYVIESNYDKDTILEIYLNEVYLGQRGSVAVHGFGEAARFYFGKPVTQLSVAECATLAGIIRGPGRYSPYKKPDLVRERRDQVLKAMFKRGSIDETTRDKAVASKLETVKYAPYTRNAPYFFDYVASQLSTMYPDADLSRIGLSLYTTLDVGIQAEAERALVKGLKALEKKTPKLKRTDEAAGPLQGAIIVLEPSTGHILAMVGGRDYGASQFNRATQAERQPGSAFKPFVFLTALEQFKLTERLDNERKTFTVKGKRWRPKNYDGQYGGTVSMREALVRSLNLPTIDLAQRVGLDNVIKTARDFGINTSLEPELALALGAFEVVPLELALAYAAFAHDGVLPHALSLKGVVAEDGKVLKRQHLKIRSVTTPARAYLMSSVMRGVVEEGTARGLKGRGINYPVAGKTGTTNDYRDAWFVGYTPDVVTLVWVGFDDATSIELAASRAALPIWADLMSHIGWRVSKRWFSPPGDVVQARVCSETGMIADSGCPEPIDEVFEAGQAPTEMCREHRSSFNRFLDSIGL